MTLVILITTFLCGYVSFYDTYIRVVCNFKKWILKYKEHIIREIKFSKGKILLGIIFSLLTILISILFIINPEIFIRNEFMTVEYIQIIGIIGTVYFSTLLYSISILLTRKYAIKITENFLIENSKYESFGKIEWKHITDIQRLKKNSIELSLDESVFQNNKVNLLQKFLLFMHNWNYEKSIIISSALKDCDRDNLYEDIKTAYENHKKLHTITKLSFCLQDKK